MSAFSSIKLVPILFIAVAISSQLPHEEDYFSSVIPVKLTRRINSTKICSYQGKNVVCDGFKDSLRLGLISPHVRVLSMKNNDLQVLEKRIMRRLQKLKFLDVRGNNIRSLRRILMKNRRLRWLLADDNKLGEESQYHPVLNHAFTKNNQLEMMTLSNNNIRKISPSVVSRNRNKLTYLDVSTNRLERVKRNTFARLTHLATLDLHGNVIKYVSSDAFNRNRNLEVLDLCDNFIAFVGNNARLDLTKNTKLKVLRMASNKLTFPNEISFGSNSALELLDLSFNKLRSSSGLNFNNSVLRQLNLSYNLIREIDANAFVDLKALTSLDLSHNEISILPGQTFSTLQGLKVLSLAYNKLRDLPESLFANNEGLVALDLRGNSLRTWQPVVVSNNWLLRFLDLRNNHLQESYFQQSDLNDGIACGRNNCQICVRLSGNSLYSATFQPVVTRQRRLVPPRKTCTMGNDGDVINCNCHEEQLSLSWKQWESKDFQ